MGTLKYKGYIGSVNYSDEDKCLYGKVMGLPSNILISYEGDNVRELQEDFSTAIDDYIDDCEKKGIEPQKTYSGSFNVRISPELHGKVAERAAQLGETINSYVKFALEQAVNFSSCSLSEPHKKYLKK